MKNRNDLQWIELDAEALRNNLRAFQAILGPSRQLLPVIKANGYGHGMVDVAKILARERVWGLGVAGSDEALALQKAGIRTNVLVLSYFEPSDLLKLRFPKKVAVVVSNKKQFELVRSIAQKRGVPVRIHVKIDTGTSRIGFLPSELSSLIRKLRTIPKNVQVEGVFSHLAEAENANQEYTRKQTAIFEHVATAIERALKRKLVKHIACSGAIVMEKATHFDVARLGLGLYGIWPSAAVKHFARLHYPRAYLRPVLHWKTRLLEVKTVPAGTTIGYGRTFTSRQRLRYGVVPVGYADGYFRSLSNKGAVLVRGHSCRVLGRVCMNIMMVDLTNVPKSRIGDEVVLLGMQGRKTIDADILAKQAGTISYEFLSRLSPAIPRYIV